MVFWRISRHADLSGTGGLRAAGRWHWAGQPIVYLAESPSGALLEVCVHTATNDVPPDFTLLPIEGPERVVPSAKEMGAGWQMQPEITRDLGSAWLRERRSVLLRVPSVIVPMTWNFLFNPLHRDAQRFRVVETLIYPFDGRIKL